MAISWADVGDRVRQARLARGLTQGQLAEQVTLHRTAVARIEAGERQVSALELFALADALSLPPALLASTPPVAVTSRRAELTDDSDDVSRRRVALDIALEAHARAVESLLRFGCLPTPQTIDPPPLQSAEDAAAAAQAMRRALGLGDEPLGRMADVCARAGLHLLVVRPGQGGASMLVDGHVGAAVVGADEAPGRRRATAAHELGHHVLQDEYQSDLGVSTSRDEREPLIDIFAAELLLPQQGLRKLWESSAELRDDFARLVRASAIYRTSWVVTVKAAVRAGLIASEHRREVLAKTPQRSDFLVVVGHEPPEDLPVGDTSDIWRRSVLQARRELQISDDRALELLHGALEKADLPDLEVSEA